MAPIMHLDQAVWRSEQGIWSWVSLCWLEVLCSRPLLGRDVCKLKWAKRWRRHLGESEGQMRMAWGCLFGRILREDIVAVFRYLKGYHWEEEFRFWSSERHDAPSWNTYPDPSTCLPCSFLAPVPCLSEFQRSTALVLVFSSHTYCGYSVNREITMAKAHFHWTDLYWRVCSNPRSVSSPYFSRPSKGQLAPENQEHSEVSGVQVDNSQRPRMKNIHTIILFLII